MTWTTPEDLRRQLERWWENGSLPAAVVTQGDLFPLRLRLSVPTSKELGDRFDEVRAWSAALRNQPHVRIVMRELRHRLLGANAVPCQAWVDTLEDALALLRKQKAAAALQQMMLQTRDRQPVLLPWLERRPLQALELEASWTRLLNVVGWLQAHPRPNIYVRQVDLPGVDSKFIEQHTRVLADLLDIALPQAALDRTAAGAAGFYRRFGFREKPLRVRLRVLDQGAALLAGGGDQDVTIDASTFARLQPRLQRVFVTENETNFLAFPAAAGAMVIFGAGYGFEMLARAHWLRDCTVHYWGDIDTHGFAILDQLRSKHPHVRSFLMDRQTLMAHREQWGSEPQQERRDLQRLTAEEAILYDDLRDNRLGERVRLEQERIGFACVARGVRELVGGA